MLNDYLESDVANTVQWFQDNDLQANPDTFNGIEKLNIS